MITSLLVPVDGSGLAETALPTASAIAARTGATLHIVHVRTMTPGTASAAEEDWARAYLFLLARPLSRADHGLAAALLPEHAEPDTFPSFGANTIAQQLVHYVAEHDIDLIVMTSHGRGGLGRFWFGSVADALLRTAAAPVLLVKPRKQHAATSPPPRLQHVLIGVAADDDAHAIVAATDRIIGPLLPRYTLLRVLPMPYTVTGRIMPATVVFPSMEAAAECEAAERQLSAAAEAAGIASAHVAAAFHATPARAILEFAEAHAVDLIVLGTHARHGIERMLLGSVAAEVAHGAHCAVLVLPLTRPPAVGVAALPTSTPNASS